MGTTATVRQANPLRRRRIIERQRPLSLLDDSNARVRTLVAPAGYGKTTLAEQWVAREGRQSAWFTVRRSSQDVAALALGLARASSTLVAGCDARLREHLRALPTPAENVEILAEILGEDLELWPSGGWLVIDEYQEIVGSREAERFVSALVAASPIQILIATRQRPSWVTTRGLLYGEVFELNQTALAMDSAEAAAVMGGHAGPSTAGLVALANGWPAVIGLASVSSAELAGDGEQVPETLYRFFAEEVFEALGAEVQEGLGVLSVAPVLDRELAGVLLGPGASVVTAAALDVGILVEHGNLLELHPLARSFLEERSAGRGFDAGAAGQCLRHYRERRDWDAAFDLVARHGMATELETLLLAALDELLGTARLSTIETWCAAASELQIETPAFALARAEVALRQGRHTVAQAYAEVAAESEGTNLGFRSLSVAGRAAHLACREEDALDLYRRAESAATTETERRDALWGQVMCSIELERPEAVSALENLTAKGSMADSREVVRAAAHRIYCQFRLGSLDLTEADDARDLLPVVGDPLIESSFQVAYAAALAASCRYSEALDVASALLECASRYRFDFAIPYAKGFAAMSHAGMRQWQEAEELLREGSAAAHSHDAHAEQFCFSVLLRVLAQQGRHQAALALQIPRLRASLPAARGELLCSRALVLASAGRVQEARRVVDGTRGSTRAVEPVVLTAAVEAIAALKGHEPDALERVAELEETAFATGAVDLLVTAYRATPELLAVLIRGSQASERMLALVRRVRDEDLASAIGQPISVDDDPRVRLSPREREVYELLRQGLTNRHIAKLLFIEESTVKVHARHIYDKVGMRSRTALAVQAALERADQATSAIGTADSTEES